MSAKRATIETHCGGYRSEAYPAVNVKVYRPWRSVKLPLDLGSCCNCRALGHDGQANAVHTFVTAWTDPRFTHEWIDEHVSDAQRDKVFNLACELGWERITDDACEIFGSQTKCYSAGRSGGWAIVTTLPTLTDDGEPQPRDTDGRFLPHDGWNKTLRAKWKRFAKHARACADDVPRLMLDSLYHFEFSAWADAQHEIAAQAARDAGMDA